LKSEPSLKNQNLENIQNFYIGVQIPHFMVSMVPNAGQEELVAVAVPILR
jgi:hypothetical protein